MRWRFSLAVVGLSAFVGLTSVRAAKRPPDGSAGDRAALSWPHALAEGNPPRAQALADVVSNRPFYRGAAAVKSALDVSSPVAKASAAALIIDWACARATAARAAASPVCAEAASVSVPMPCA